MIPTMRAPAVEGPLDLALVVRLDEHREAELERERVEVGEEPVVGERSHDEQHRIRADAARLEHLDLVEHEVLAERGKRGRVARGLEIGDGSAEEGVVGEHGQRGRPARFVDTGRLLRIEVGSKVALRRRPPFDLRDHREPSVVALERGGEVTRRRGRERRLPDLRTRRRLAQDRHLVALRRQDLVEDGHRDRASHSRPEPSRR